MKGRSVLDTFFFKWSFWRAEKDATKQKVLSFQEVGQKRKMVVPSLTLQTSKFFPLKRVLKNYRFYPWNSQSWSHHLQVQALERDNQEKLHILTAAEQHAKDLEKEIGKCLVELEKGLTLQQKCRLLRLETN